ncbi:MAG: hypothetical protein ABI778_09835 [Ignavibacteriota bacterium]
MNSRDPIKNMQRITSVVCISAIVLSSLRIFYHLFSGSNGFLVVPQDDFYYYYITAKHIVRGGSSTFDGLTITNGYHPLWMLSVIVIEILSFGDQNIFFLLFALICSLSAYISYSLVLKILRRGFGDSAMIYAAVVLASVSISWMSFWGMEITLAIPLMLNLIYRVQLKTNLSSFTSNYSLGFIASLLILSRLDSVLFVALVLLYLLYRAKFSGERTTRIVATFLAGSLLVPLYLLSNYFFFGSFSTVSAQAKQLITHPALDLIVFRNIWSMNDGLVASILVPIALLVLWFYPNQKRMKDPILLSLILVYPFLFLILYRVFSDWYFFSWYGYAFPIANALALSIILNAAFEKYLAKRSVVCAYIALGAVSFFLISSLAIRTIKGTINWQPHPGSIIAHAQKIKEFTDKHPGVYAMGDRAGLTTYIINKSVLQLEGIISDQKMVRHISAEDDMEKVMREYHVNYGIFSVYSPMEKIDNCYKIEMPLKDLAGERSKRMRGTFCDEPVFFYESAGVPKIYTYIFELR